MTLAERLQELVRAAFSGIYVQSFEHDDAVAEIARLCRDEHWTLAAWDVDRGLALAGGQAAPEATDPLAAVRAARELANLNASASSHSDPSSSTPSPDGAGLLILRNFHRFLGAPEIVQALLSVPFEAKQSRSVVGTAP